MGIQQVPQVYHRQDSQMVWQPPHPSRQLLLLGLAVEFQPQEA